MASPKSGSSVSADSPNSPLDAADADAAQAGSSSENQSSTQDEETTESGNEQNPEEEDAHWIAIKLEDHEGRPAMFARYKVKLPDGTETRGTLDKDGKARLDPVPAGNCEISFPDVHKDEWSLKG